MGDQSVVRGSIGSQWVNVQSRGQSADSESIGSHAAISCREENYKRARWWWTSGQLGGGQLVARAVVVDKWPALNQDSGGG